MGRDPMEEGKLLLHFSLKILTLQLSQVSHHQRYTEINNISSLPIPARAAWSQQHSDSAADLVKSLHPSLHWVLWGQVPILDPLSLWDLHLLFSPGHLSGVSPVLKVRGRSDEYGNVFKCQSQKRRGFEITTYLWPRVPRGPHETGNSRMTLGKHKREFFKVTHKELFTLVTPKFQTTIQNLTSNPVTILDKDIGKRKKKTLATKRLF